MKTLITKITTLAAAMLFIAACSSTTTSGLTGVNRSQLQLIPAEELNAQADQQYRQVIQGAKTKGQVDTTSNNAKRVDRVFKRLLPHTTVFRPDAQNFNWEINVIKSNEVNAFAMPGGKMVIYTGIIDRLKLSDDEIAAIIGHEMAHVLREHSRESVSQELLKSSSLSIISSIAGLGSVGDTLLQQAGELAFSLPFSRKMETEADIIGLELMARAGYNPEASVTLWEKMSSLGGSGASILSTHPAGPDRAAELQRQIPKVAHFYKK